MSEVAALEDVCERAWPPRERVELDGAVLRFTDGFTRRANSARVDGGGSRPRRPDRAGRARVPQPRAAAGLPADAALAACVRAPAGRARLHRRHRGRRDGGRGAAGGRSGTRPATRSRCEPELGEEWLRVFQAIERHWPAEQDPGARWVLGSGASPRRFALARVDGAPAATGYARLEDDWLYIACVGTFPEHRRRGLARAVSERLFAWGAGERRAARDLAGRDEKRRSAGALRATRLPPALRLSRPRTGLRRSD